MSTMQSVRDDFCHWIFSMAGQWRKTMLPIGAATIRSALGKRLSEGAFSALPPLPLSDGGQMAEADSLLPSGASGRWRNF
jgi:hypothetical protein